MKTLSYLTLVLIVLLIMCSCGETSNPPNFDPNDTSSSDSDTDSDTDSDSDSDDTNNTDDNDSDDSDSGDDDDDNDDNDDNNDDNNNDDDNNDDDNNDDDNNDNDDTIIHDTDCDDLDSDWWCDPIDCDDTNDAVHPGAVEDPENGIDDDCDGITDEEPNNTDPECGEPILKAIIRDFKYSHPDFEVFSGSNATTGLVKDELNEDDKPVFLSQNGSGNNGQQLTTAENFAQWYVTDTSDSPVNMEIEYEIELIDIGNDTWEYDTTAFFPANGGGFGPENGNPNNFAFTTEIHTNFIYKGGEVFTFRGDDDLWMFIDGKLALDIGGLHPPALGTADLDTLNLTPGKQYKMSIFHAERHTNGSNFKITTTIDCFDPDIN